MTYMNPPVLDGGRVTSANRNIVRKWLTGCGVPSAIVRDLTLRQLQHALDNPETVAELISHVGEEKPQPQPQPQPVRAAAPAAPDSGGVDLSPVMDALTQVLQQHQRGGATVDEAQIIELIEKHSTKRHVVEVSRVGADPVRVADAHPKLAEVVDWLAVGVPVYLVGGAGSGKSTLARQAAEALGLDYYEHGAVMTRYDLDVKTTLQGETVESAFYRWFKHGGVLLIDEMDASDARALVQWNNAIRGGAGTLATFMNGETVEKHRDAVVIAAANTIGQGANRQYVGRYQLDAATLDGFAYVEIDYSQEIETALSRGRSDWLEVVRAYRVAAAIHGARLIVSPRAVDFGARLLESGADFDAVLPRLVDSLIRKGIAADQWRTIHQEAAAHVRALAHIDA